MSRSEPRRPQSSQQERQWESPRVVAAKRARARGEQQQQPRNAPVITRSTVVVATDRHDQAVDTSGIQKHSNGEEKDTSKRERQVRSRPSRPRRLPRLSERRQLHSGKSSPRSCWTMRARRKVGLDQSTNKLETTSSVSLCRMPRLRDEERTTISSWCRRRDAKTKNKRNKRQPCWPCCI